MIDPEGAVSIRAAGRPPLTTGRFDGTMTGAMERHVTSTSVPFVPRAYSVARYGWWGTPVILFPTGGSDYLDNERFGLVGALEPLIRAGRIKVYSVDAPNQDVWTNHAVPPWHKSWVQAEYDRWLVDTLLPWIDHDCGGSGLPVVVAGASLGAYQALNALTKHPEQVAAGIGMSGTYVLNRRMGTFRDDAYYYNQPVQFLPGLGESTQLHQLRQRHFEFALGSGPHESPDYTWWAASVLGARGVPNHVDVWGEGSDHDWPTWRAMLPTLLERVLPRVEGSAA